MTVSKVDVAVLGCLAESPRHGYELLEVMRARHMDRWADVGKASVYQGLRRLERAGLIAGKAQEGAAAPDRRVYRITKSGQAPSVRRARGTVRRPGAVRERRRCRDGVPAPAAARGDARRALQARTRALQASVEDAAPRAATAWPATRGRPRWPERCWIDRWSWPRRSWPGSRDSGPHLSELCVSTPTVGWE